MARLARGHVLNVNASRRRHPEPRHGDDGDAQEDTVANEVAVF